MDFEEWFQLTCSRLVRARLLCQKFPRQSRQILLKCREQGPLLLSSGDTSKDMSTSYKGKEGLEITRVCFLKCRWLAPQDFLEPKVGF